MRWSVRGSFSTQRATLSAAVFVTQKSFSPFVVVFFFFSVSPRCCIHPLLQSRLLFMTTAIMDVSSIRKTSGKKSVNKGDAIANKRAKHDNKKKRKTKKKETTSDPGAPDFVEEKRAFSSRGSYSRGLYTSGTLSEHPRNRDVYQRTRKKQKKSEIALVFFFLTPASFPFLFFFRFAFQRSLAPQFPILLRCFLEGITKGEEKNNTRTVVCDEGSHSLI